MPQEGPITIMNRGRRIYPAFMLVLLITYPLVMWFGWAILNYPPSLLGFTAIWLFVLFLWGYFRIDIHEIRFESDGLSARYRKGWKHTAYSDIVCIVWGKDFLGGGFGLWTRRGDVVVLGGMDNQLAEETLKTLRERRPDLLPGQDHQGPMSASWGVLSDEEHLNAEWRIRPRGSRDYERRFWGYEPRRSGGESKEVMA